MIHELAGTTDTPNADMESKVSDEEELSKDNKGSKINDLMQSSWFLRLGW